MVKFKCNVSGNIVSFEHLVDIATTRRNPAYTEVKEEIKEEVKPVVKTTKKTVTPSEEV